MKRRNFLASAGVIAGTTLSPLAFAAKTAIGPAPPTTIPRFQLVRTASAAAGKASTLWVELDRWATAPLIPALAQFQLSALFYPKNVAVPFGAWSFNSATPYANSSGAAFAAGADTLRALRVDYRLAGPQTDSPLASEQCDLPVPLQPGSYALIGPLSGGQTVDLSQYRAIGNARTLDFMHTNGTKRDFDFLTFHIAAL